MSAIAEQGEKMVAAVRDRYGRIAEGKLDGCCGASASPCSGTAVTDLSESLGYSPAELQGLAEANLGLGCGAPVDHLKLQPGEHVLDLGSGAGIDVFLAAKRVGAEGRVIGVDMTPEMLQKARANAARLGFPQVEFREGRLERLPVDSASVDAVTSNCVINLVPDKAVVFHEIGRVLKPGGRVAVSDLALLRPLPKEIVGMVEALVGCVAGAVLVDETERMARDAGLADVLLRKKPEYVRAVQSFEDPLYRKIAEHLPPGTSAEDFITSLDVEATKPKAPKACCG